MTIKSPRREIGQRASRKKKYPKMIITKAQTATSTISRASKVRRSCVVLFCMADITCASDMAGSRSGCCCQSFFSSSSFILRFLRHQTGKFLFGAMQHDANVIGIDARDFCHLFVGQVFEEKGDERFFERVEFENYGVKMGNA